MDRLEVKAPLSVSDAGEIVGMAWPFGSADRVGDVIEKGAINTPSRLPMLFAHDQGQVVGVWDEIAETDQGVTVKGRLLIDEVSRAREVRALIREGAVTGLSIGFVTKRAQSRRGGGRTIAALDLHEISIVPIPAHPGARIIAAKSAPTEENGYMPDSNETGAAPEIAALETKMNELSDSMKSVVKLGDRLDKVEAKLNRPAIAANDEPAETELSRKAFAAYLRFGDRAPVEELNALTVANDPQGGYLAPKETSAEIIRNLVEFSPIRTIASVRTTGAPSVQYPARTGITNAKWKGETQESEESEPNFGQLEVPIKEINTYVDISNQLLADSAGQADQEVALALAEDFGQKEAVAFVKGAGNLDPRGFMVHPDIAYTANGHATNLSADALISLLYEVPATYRNRGHWVMSGTTLAAIRKLRDGTTGNYLWQPSYADGQPETILGRPVLEAVEVDEPASGKFPIIYGDFSGFRIVDRLEFSTLVNPYSRATEGITRIHATRRVGGDVLQPGKFRKLKMATS